MHTHEDDLIVIRSVLQGRQSDYAILVRQYEQYVFTLAMRYVQNREVAEELAQDIFVKAYRHLGSFKGDSKFSTWLYTIVHTTCLSHLRQKDNALILLEEEKLISLENMLPYDNPASKLEKANTKKILDKAIKHLPEAEGQTLILFYQGAQSVEEISKITGTTVANVKVRLFRARRKLREVIEKHYKEELMS